MTTVELFLPPKTCLYFPFSPSFFTEKASEKENYFHHTLEINNIYYSILKERRE